MALLKGTGQEEVRINCEARIPSSERPGKIIPVKFVGVYKAPQSMDEIRDVRTKLFDEDDDYGDEQLVNDYFVTFEKMPGPSGGFVEPDTTDEEGVTALEQALSNRDYFVAIARGCAEAVFGKEGRRKN